MNAYERSAETMREIARKAEGSKTGKNRGYTAEHARRVAEHLSAIGRGEIPIGTPIKPEEK